MRVHAYLRNQIIAALAVAISTFAASSEASAASYVFATHNHSPTNGAVTLINPATNTATGSQINVGSSPNGAAVTPDGKYLYVANSGSGTVTEIDTSKFTKRTVTVGNQP